MSIASVNPIWDQHFQFNIDNDVTEILIKLFDKDDLRSDDVLGTVV
jgi:Ca2+-dependent lipid-binding protein